MAAFIRLAEANLPVPVKSLDRKGRPAMVSISTTSDETDKFENSPFVQAVAGVLFRFEDLAVALHNYGGRVELKFCNEFKNRAGRCYLFFFTVACNGDHVDFGSHWMFEKKLQNFVGLVMGGYPDSRRHETLALTRC